MPRKTRNIDLRTAEFKKKKKTKTTEVYNIDKANRLRAPAAAKLDTFARGAKGARDEPTYSRPGSPPPFVDNQERICSTETGACIYLTDKISTITSVLGVKGYTTSS